MWSWELRTDGGVELTSVELRNGAGVELMNGVSVQLVSGDVELTTVAEGNMVGDMESIHVALGVKLVIYYMEECWCGVGCR